MMTRHAARKLPYAVDNRPTRLPVSIRLDPLAAVIMVEVKKVQADVAELQENMEQETAAKNALCVCVEQLQVDAAEAKQYIAQATKDVRNPNNTAKTFQLLLKTLPCKSLDELDWLLAFVDNRSSEWTEYVKLLGGTEPNSAIKSIIDTTMERSVQKQLSWNGMRSKKPSLKFKYKGILDGIHVAMKEQFKDYTIARGEAKIQILLRNAARNTCDSNT